MTIDEPTAGGPILDTWGQAVAQRLNAFESQVLAADVATNSATDQDTGFEFEAVNGKTYLIQVEGEYEAAQTNQGLRIGIDTPSGTDRCWARIWGDSTATGETRHSGGASARIGRNTTDTAAAERPFWFTGRYECTSSGTVKVVFYRGGTSGSTGITLKAGTACLVLAES